MRAKELFLTILLVSIVLIVGCTTAPVCGDGICSIDEDASNTCPQDCDKNPDIKIINMQLESEALAYNSNKLEISLENHGYAPSKIVGELEVYLGDRMQRRRTIDFQDYGQDDVLEVGETLDFEEHLWLWEPGNYKVKFKVEPVGKEDLVPSNNFRELEFTVEEPHYPEILIEEDVGDLSYDHSREVSDWLEFLFENNLGTAYEAEYRGSWAQARVTIYEEVVDMYEFRDEMNDRFSSDYYWLYLDLYDDQYVYVVNEHSYYRYERDYENRHRQLYWLSGNKIIRLYYSGLYDEYDDFNNLVSTYLDKYPSDLTTAILCGNERCDMYYWTLYLNLTSTTRGYELTLLEYNVDTGWISLMVDDNTYSLEKDEVLVIGGAYTNIQNKGVYSWEYCRYPEDVTVTFTAVDYNQTCTKALYESCTIEEVEITPQWINANSGEVNFHSNEWEWTTMKVGETRFVGNIKIYLDSIDAEKVCSTYTYVSLNLGENEKTCSPDCLPTGGGGGGGVGIAEPVEEVQEEEWN